MNCLYCTRLAVARGLCKLHWQRWRQSEPMERPLRKYGSGLAKGWIHHGYRWICDQDGEEVLEHRHFMEQSLGRKLHTDEVVHHRDGNPLNNTLVNLEVLSRAAHTSHHRPHRVPCRVCGKDDPHGAKGLCGKHYMQARAYGVPT